MRGDDRLQRAVQRNRVALRRLSPQAGRLTTMIRGHKFDVIESFPYPERDAISNKSDRRMTPIMNGQERREANAEADLDTTVFLKVADKFIDVANRENRRIEATQLHMAFLFGSARYSAFVARQFLNIGAHEEFVAKMTGQYANMLRRHLADDTLGGDAV